MNGSIDHAIGSLQSDVKNNHSDIKDIKICMEKIVKTQEQHATFISEVRGSWRAVSVIGSILSVLLAGNIVVQVFF